MVACKAKDGVNQNENTIRTECSNLNSCDTEIFENSRIW